jgi:predicted nucleotidyltransferase
MPVMGIKSENKIITAFLFNKTRRGLLALFFTHVDKEFYVNQVMQLVQSGSGAVQRELRLMTEAGLLQRYSKGNLVYYRANTGNTIFPELKSLVDKGLLTVPLNKSSTGKKQAKRDLPIQIPSKKIAGFCLRNHIRKLSLFGSVLRDDFRPDSDIDVLVEFEPGHTPGWGIVAMENELSSILARKAEMHTDGDLSRYFRDNVVREAEVQYSVE